MRLTACNSSKAQRISAIQPPVAQCFWPTKDTSTVESSAPPLPTRGTDYCCNKYWFNLAPTSPAA